MAKALLVIPSKNFRDEELSYTQEELERAGIETVIAGKSTDTATGMLGGTAQPEVALSDAKAEDYDAVVFIGGSGAAAYFNDSAALDLAKSAHEKGKVVAALCIAPVILANAGILKGRKATVFPSGKKGLEEKGAQCTGESLTTDGRIITASGPAAAREFGRKIAEALG